MKSIRGFTVIEIIIGFAMLAILVGLTLPLYQQQSRKVYRLDGQNKLLEVMRLQQAFFVDNLRYSDQLEGDLQLTAVDGDILSEKGFYTVAAEPCDANLTACVRLVANPLDNTQETLTLDSRGHGTPADIW